MSHFVMLIIGWVLGIVVARATARNHPDLAKAYEAGYKVGFAKGAIAGAEAEARHRGRRTA